MILWIKLKKLNAISVREYETTRRNLPVDIFAKYLSGYYDCGKGETAET
jgi:hypothetical protein